MILPLVLTLLTATTPAAAPAAARDHSPVKVWLDRDRVEPGDWARARVRVEEDGYLLVLASDAEGRVRVLFPLDPGADAFVRAGRTVELRGRGARGSFLIGDGAGTGVVMAVRTAEPLQFTGFVRGDHWDYGALESAARGAGAGADTGAQHTADETLLGLAQQMTGGNQLDYDAASYTVGGGRGSGEGRYADGRYADDAYYHPAYDPAWDYAYVYPYWYGCFDPWFCGPAYFTAFQFSLFYSPFYARPFFFRPFFVRPFLPRPLFARPFYPRTYRPFVNTRGYVGKTYIPSPRPVQYRNRGQTSFSGMRSFGGMPSRGGFASPRGFGGPRMAAPSFGGRGSGGGRGGGRRR